VIRDADQMRVVTTRFRNVLVHRGYHGDSNGISQTLLAGKGIIINEKTVSAAQVTGGWPNIDWMGSWRLERLISDDDEPRLISDDDEPFFQARQGDDFHECELSITGFNNHESLIQKDLGPIYLRYSSFNGPMKRSSDGNYKNWSDQFKLAVDWTGGNRGRIDPPTAFQKGKPVIEDLVKKILGFTDDDYEVPNVLPILVISPPKGDSGLTKEQHKNHLGYLIGEEITSQILTKYSNTTQLMAFDIYQNSFKQVEPGVSWGMKARNKQGQWRDEVSPEARESIQQAELVIIADDTMISYSTMLRIAMTVRKNNPHCGILCAAGFALTGERDGKCVSDTPEILYQILKDAVEKQEGVE